MDINAVKNILEWGAGIMALPYVYRKPWGDDTTRDEYYEKVRAFHRELKPLIDWENLTVAECKVLRFGRWDEGSKLYLIPAYLAPLIPKGLKLQCISGKEVVYTGKNIDLDFRFGCLGYGIIPKDLQDSSSK